MHRCNICLTKAGISDQIRFYTSRCIIVLGKYIYVCVCVCTAKVESIRQKNYIVKKTGRDNVLNVLNKLNKTKTAGSPSNKSCQDLWK